MATVAKAKAKKAGIILTPYPKPDGWLPHFLMIDSGGHK
jgi:hypothetical protein